MEGSPAKPHYAATTVDREDDRAPGKRPLCAQRDLHFQLRLDDSDLRRWGLQLRERLGFKRAAIAVARKLAVIMHAMLKSREAFKTTTIA